MDQERIDHTREAIEAFLKEPQTRRGFLIGLGATGAVVAVVVGVKALIGSPNEGGPFQPTTSEVVALNAEQSHQVDQLLTTGYKGLTQNYLVDATDGALRTIYDPDKRNTDAEVQAYSMLQAVHAGDQETFDRLWKYLKRYRNKVGTISWLMNANGSIAGSDSAFDSTQDTAAALALAHRKGWKGTYADDAKSLLQNSMEAEIEPATFIPRGGSYGGGSSATDPSYYDPYAYEELFAQYDSSWLKVAAACRNVLDNVATRIQNGQIKGYPDWVTKDGLPVMGVEDKPQIGYDSTRIALRQLQGALFLSGESKTDAAKHVGLYNNFYEQIVNRGTSPNITNIVDGYTTSGKPTGQNSGTAFASAAVAASLASTDGTYRNYMIGQLPTLAAQYPFNFYMYLNALRAMSGKV